MAIALRLEDEAHSVHVLQVDTLAVRHSHRDVSGVGIILACRQESSDEKMCQHVDKLALSLRCRTIS